MNKQNEQDKGESVEDIRQGKQARIEKEKKEKEKQMPNVEQGLTRIAQMESFLDETTALTAKAQEQLDAVKAIKEHTQTLFQYYGSEDWHADRDLTLPEGFKAGVLSEDSVYDAITDLRDTAIQMPELGTDILKTWI